MIKDPEEAAKSITRWLKEEGAFKEDKETEGYHFNIAAEYKPGSGRLVSIFQNEKSTDKVMLTSGMAFDEATKEHFKGMKKGKRASFLEELRYGLLKMPGNFNLIVDDDGTIDEVRLSNFIFYDGLTKNGIFRALEEDWKKFLFITWKISDHFQK
jgi:hypothetical protein